jgi:hypothetical protein
MAFGGWNVPANGRLWPHAPHPASIDCLLQGAAPQQCERLEFFCTSLFLIDQDILPDLAFGGRLRPLVHRWAGAQLRFWDENLAHFGRSSATSMVNDSVCRAVIKAGLATASPGDAEAWCSAQGAVVRADFEKANIRLTSLAGGSGSIESLVANIATLQGAVTSLAGTVKKQTDQMSEMKASMVRLSEESAAAFHELAALRQETGSGSGFPGAAGGGAASLAAPSPALALSAAAVAVAPWQPKGAPPEAAAAQSPPPTPVAPQEAAAAAVAAIAVGAVAVAVGAVAVAVATAAAVAVAAVAAVPSPRAARLQAACWLVSWR